MKALIEPIHKANGKLVGIFLLVGYVVALALYYVDEGNYHFDNLVAHPVEWVFVTMYAVLIAICCRIVFAMMQRTSLGYNSKLAISVIGGIASIPVLILVVGALVRLVS